MSLKAVLLCFMLFTTTCYADVGGVDFSMMGNGTDGEKQYSIPEFTSQRDAIYYANKIKWIEPHRKYLIKYINLLKKLSDLNNPDGSIPSMRQIENARVLLIQVEYCEIALAIINNFKRHGIRGDAAQVGSVVYIGECPYELGVHTK